MGERVVINPAAVKEPTPAVPLGYGHGGRRGDTWRRFSSTVRAGAADGWRAVRTSSAELLPAVVQLIIRLGGWRQIGFALGLGFVLAGIGVAMDRSGDASFLMWLGGLLIGLCLRIHALKG
ncbi:MAG: hypothetical protein WBD40_10465 [Tepidisphaeraceae bacterium]